MSKTPNMSLFKYQVALVAIMNIYEIRFIRIVTYNTVLSFKHILYNQNNN